MKKNVLKAVEAITGFYMFFAVWVPTLWFMVKAEDTGSVFYILLSIISLILSWAATFRLGELPDKYLKK